jgi:signal transduction histidine kinase
VVGREELPEAGPTLVVGSLVGALDYDDLAVPGRDFLPAPYVAQSLVDRVRVAAVRSLNRGDRYGPADYHRIVREISDCLKTAILFFDTSGRPWLRNRMVRHILALAGYDPTTGLAEHVYGTDRVTRVKRGRNILTEALEGNGRGVIYWIGDPAHRKSQRAIITEAHTIRRANGVALGTAMIVYDVTDVATLIGERADYMAAVSHELRTPLTGAIGFLELIAESEGFESWGVSAEFAVVQRNLEQLAGLIGRLSNIGLRSGALSLAPVDLRQMVDQAAGAALPKIADAGLHLTVSLPESSLPGRADAVRLRQVLDNLLSNAVKYTPEGGTIALTLTRERGTAVISVADTGIGIDPGEQDRVFDRFYRTPALRGGQVAGHGIGLAIAKAVTQAHDGTLTVKSTPGEGSTFTIRLPLRPRGSALAEIGDDAS